MDAVVPLRVLCLLARCGLAGSGRDWRWCESLPAFHWSGYTSLFPGEALDLKWQWAELVLPTKTNETWFQGQVSEGCLSCSLRPQGWRTASRYVQDITFLKNKPWYQRAHVFLLHGATHPCAVRGRANLGYLCQRWMLSAGTWTSSNSSAWLLSPRRRMCGHGGEERVCCWRSLACARVPSPQEWCEETGTKQTGAFGQPCPRLTMKAGYRSPAPELSLFFPKGTGPGREPAALTTVGQAVMGLTARLLYGGW